MNPILEGEIGMSLVNVFLLFLLFATGIAIARMRSLFAIVMLSGVYSLVSATWYVAVDAVDVAFTEAAVGAGMSTAVLLGAGSTGLFRPGWALAAEWPKDAFTAKSLDDAIKGVCAEFCVVQQALARRALSSS